MADDTHLLDDVSATLLHHLVTATVATVVATVRSDMPAPDAVTATWKDGHHDRITVSPLSQDETNTLLESVLGGQVQATTAERIWRLSQATPSTCASWSPVARRTAGCPRAAASGAG